MVEFFYGFFRTLVPALANIIALNNIVKNKITKKESIVIVLLSQITLLVVEKIDPKICLVALYLIPSLFLIIKTKKIFLSFIIELLIAVLIGAMDSLFYLIVYVVLGLEYNFRSVSYWIISGVILVLIYLMTKLLDKILSKYKEVLIENYKSKYLLLLYIMLLITFIVFYFNLNWEKYFDFNVAVKLQALIGFGYGVVCMSVCMCLLFMSKREEKYKHEQVQLENLKEYTSNLEELYTEMRKFRHDYINIISSIAAFIDERDCDGLEEYFNTNIQPLNKMMNRNNYKLGLLKNIQLQEVKGIISAKVIRAQELGIDVVIDIIEMIDKIDMDKVDLVRCLGILLDNAIDASIESNERKINVALIKKNQSIIIVISNTYGEDILPISKMFKQGMSSKGANRGLGLSNLKEILDGYRNISLDTYIKDEEFVQEICIYTR